MTELGYKEDFLGKNFIVDLPVITVQHDSSILRLENLREEQIIDYPNYSVVMNKKKRQAFFSAANADFNKNVGEGRRFRIDQRIDSGAQLGNIYYKDIGTVKNPYDRGHLTRRDAISWGKTKKYANKASKDSCYFTNVSLQHKNFNQDEWAALEKAIEKTNNDLGNKFNIFTGPIFFSIDRYITPDETLEPARIPSAFWKVITYIGKESKQIEVNAFLVFQDNESISAMSQVLHKNKIKPFNFYQTSTTLVEELTGIEFPEVCFDNNPLYYYESENTKKKNIKTPQMNDVTAAKASKEIIFKQ